MIKIQNVKKFNFFFALFYLSLGAYAQTAPIVSASPAFAQADDPYYPYATLPSGPHQGERVPVEFRRSIQILHKDADSTVTVANFAHNDSYYLAKIPLKGLEKIIFQIDYFSGSIPAAHSEIRLRFRDDSPILLYPQLKSEENKSAVAIHEAVFSIEAVKSESTALSFMKGFGKNYAVAYRFISMKQKHHDLVELAKERVTQYELNLSEADREAILTEAIETSDRVGVSQFYNTWKRNCTTELIRIIDNAVPMAAWRVVLRPVTFVGAHYPVFVRSTLRSRGLLGDELPVFDQDPSVDVKETALPSVTLK
ncbi:MAG: DUF4105 domain-containing protein [Bdellovibrionales bacterium]|nr:DUF4105 domain-containing protein [Oligoflexia bacterium]